MRIAKLFPAFALVVGLLPAAGIASARKIKPQPVQKLHVVGNGVACFVAPCPSYTAVTEQGEVIPLASVVLPAGFEEERDLDLNVSGLEVEGVITKGEWKFGSPGNVLKVTDVLDVAQTFTAFHNGIFCITAPCPSLTVVSQDGVQTNIAGIDMSMFDMFNPEELGETALQVETGDLVVKGFIVKGSQKPFGKGTQLLVTKIVGPTAPFTVKKSGIVCVVAPCPVFAAIDANGASQLIDSVNLNSVRLTVKEKAKLQKALVKGAKVKGYISAEEAHPAVGSVFFVTGVL